jgi:hypothetical protein
MVSSWFLPTWNRCRNILKEIKMENYKLMVVVPEDTNILTPVTTIMGYESEDRTLGQVSIPMVEGNRYYEEYLKWVAEGNTPEPADE